MGQGAQNLEYDDTRLAQALQVTSHQLQISHIFSVHSLAFCRGCSQDSRNLFNEKLVSDMDRAIHASLQAQPVKSTIKSHFNNQTHFSTTQHEKKSTITFHLKEC